MNAARRPARADFTHLTRIVVRWGDMDSLGHVNNAKFFTYDEQARLEYFALFEAVVPGMWKQQGLILAKLGCDFLQQLHYPATLDVAFRVSRFGRSSMETEGAVFEGERLVAVSQGVVVWFDYQSQKPAPIPDAVKAMIREREAVAPLEV
ncbi:MAG: thioesterase family protein [Stagnimonas sp.]|nr:thioesterase family protein [Stagnimonas sp.]